MKIGILLADELREGLLPHFENYARMFSRYLAGHGLDFNVYDVRKQQYPATINECDGYLITGSRHGVYDELPWLAPLFDFTRLLHAEKIPLLGICFGQQAVTQALGGEVKKSQKGWGMGAHEWNVCAHAAWMQPAKQRLRLLCMHQDQVERLPPGARLLAGSSFCENAAFSIGEHIFCLQGHPEFVPEYMHALLEYRKQDAPAAAVAEAVATTDTPLDRALCAQWMVNFFKHRRTPD